MHVLQLICLLDKKLLLYTMSASKGKPNLTYFVWTISSLVANHYPGKQRAILHSAKENGQLSVSVSHFKAAEMSNEDRWERLSDSNSLRKDSNHYLRGIGLASKRLCLSWNANTKTCRIVLVLKQD